MGKCENFQVVPRYRIVLRKYILILNSYLTYLLCFKTDLLENAIFKTCLLHLTEEKHNMLASKFH